MGEGCFNRNPRRGEGVFCPIRALLVMDRWEIATDHTNLARCIDPQTSGVSGILDGVSEILDPLRGRVALNLFGTNPSALSV